MPVTQPYAQLAYRDNFGFGEGGGGGREKGGGRGGRGGGGGGVVHVAPDDVHVGGQGLELLKLLAGDEVAWRERIWSLKKEVAYRV